MTQINIDEMPAGREMDALIAEIMGCQWGLDSLGRKALFNPDDVVFAWYGSKGEIVGPGLAYYSINIAAAWIVVEYILGHPDQKVYQAFRNYMDCDLGWCAPKHIICLRICRAAYKAVMVRKG